VAIALLIASVLLVTFYAVNLPTPDKYTTIYLLDSNGKASDYPENLTAYMNYTFNVNVENHKGRMLNYMQVQVKIASESNPTFPLEINAVQIINRTDVQDGTSWQSSVTLSLNQPRNYLVVFELWITSKTNNSLLEYSGNFVALNVVVT
jgi:uncharacterized membrane protein